MFDRQRSLRFLTSWTEPGLWPRSFRRGEEVLDEIAFLFLSRAFARGHADHALAAAALRAECTDRRAFDKSAVGDTDNASFVRDEILHVDLTFVSDEFS